MLTQWHISAFLVSAEDDADPALVNDVRELRARVLFDHGRRPAFRAADGSHVDDQELDFFAWHFIARREPGGTPLGYVRLSTPRAGHLYQSRAFLGAEHYEETLRNAGVTAEETFEHSRLVVEHRARKLGLGIHLNAVAIGAAHALGAKAMIGTSGTKDGQDAFHERFGFTALTGTRRYVEQYTEDVVVMLHRVADGAGEHHALVEQARAEFPSYASAAPAWAGAGGHRRPDGLTARADQDSWRPVLFTPTVPADREALTDLLASGVVREVHDTLDDQLEELVRSREPWDRPDAEALRRKKDEQLGGVDAWEYGTWAWYPWSARLVHVLPREEFRLVRTDRNRGKVERPQQRELFGKRVGIVGLSVGNSAAVTFALEGIGGAYKLADFDAFGLSNLNRLRAGVHHLGVNKAVISARQMFEIDPYLDIEIFTDGLTEHNLDAFVDGLDLLVEECDTPYAKIAARERARDLGVPVVMDCNDRGMLDVERFDLEPDRPLLHGLIGDISSADLKTLSHQEKVDIMLAMVDAEKISPELRASFDELGKTLSSWPQLASGVALGGALTAEVARRILLGAQCMSGRFYVDFAELITPATNTVSIGSLV
ncbi:ThiF family adenylyltransferase [Umezawaea sp. Da 62-37]|uniref:ThiF family adenylyltransferase n=1 Tax=Umezawaea sp. Da 62-37 TaxID=3075927 RepID=UPI0028F743EC|nr:ThiF family adenylyltransferase [Umezawaea sp. Da 62-37]WNV87798.1 ThiF family adenylyltransferase [Umezawaea sp. Da 62-37]